MKHQQNSRDTECPDKPRGATPTPTPKQLTQAQGSILFLLLTAAAEPFPKISFPRPILQQNSSKSTAAKEDVQQEIEQTSFTFLVCVPFDTLPSNLVFWFFWADSLSTPFLL